MGLNGGFLYLVCKKKLSHKICCLFRMNMHENNGNSYDVIMIMLIDFRFEIVGTEQFSKDSLFVFLQFYVIVKGQQHLRMNMGHDRRKLVFGVFDQMQHKSAYTVTEAGY